MKSKKLSYYGQRLVARLKAERDIDLPTDVEIHRTYAGHWQRSKGAMSWFFYSPTTAFADDIGSQESVRDLAICQEIIVVTNRGVGRELLIENDSYKMRENN